MTTICPICGDANGFHDEEVHAARPLPSGTALPVDEAVALCRSCGLPLIGPGAEGCRYPKHVRKTSTKEEEED